MRAVVGERAADQVDALGLALRRPVLARELGRRVDRVAAAEAQEDARIGHRRELHEAIDELERRRVGDVAERLEGLERAQLRGDGLDHLLAAVADVGVPEARRCRRGSAGPCRPRGRRPRRARSRARGPRRPPCRRTGASRRRSRRVTLGAARRVSSASSARALCYMSGMSQPDPWLEHYGDGRRTPRRARRLRPRARRGRAARARGARRC